MINNSSITAKLLYHTQNLENKKIRSPKKTVQNKKTYLLTSRRLFPHPAHIEMKTALSSRQEKKIKNKKSSNLKDKSINRSRTTTENKTKKLTK